MSSQRQIFDQALRTIVQVPLEKHGFAFDRSRTFRCIATPLQAAKIINFQLGQRHLEGKFTVNLGFYMPGDVAANSADLLPEKAHEYHCSLSSRARLGQLLPTPFTRARSLPFIGFLFGSQDRWWPFASGQAQAEASLQDVLSLLEKYGLPWLETQAKGRIN